MKTRGDNMKFSITKPSVWMYATEDLCGEVSDELLFGTVVEIISENDTCAYCRTDYGYYGYINKWDMCECDTEDCRDSVKQFIYKRCDILTEPQYRTAPYMSLSKGSRIQIINCYNERYSECMIGKKKFFISNHALKKESSSSFSEDFVQTAKSYLGTPYRWGGKSDTGLDCSGLVFMCARLCNKTIYRDAVPKNEYVNIIEEKDAKPGDLIYFKGHVAIITGEAEIIHSSAKFGCVICQPFCESGLKKSDIVSYASIK